MTLVRDEIDLAEPLPENEIGDVQLPPSRGSAHGGRTAPSWFHRRSAGLLAAFFVVLVVATGIVVYFIGPLVHDRDQRVLMNSERTAISDAARDNEGLYRETLPTVPPVPGQVVGILAIPVIGLQQAVVEGVGPSQTIAAPGHVPGTAALGQPGNSAIVGRRDGYGGPFGSLGALRVGDRILTATTEGQSVYVVRSVRTVTLTTPGTQSAAPAAGAAGTATTTTVASTTQTTARGSKSAARAGTHEATESVRTLYGPSVHNQLTLVTSGSAAPWNSAQAVVVVARLHGQPYTPTPQESLSPSQEGNDGDPAALAWLLLALLALVAVFIGAVALYRRT